MLRSRVSIPVAAVVAALLLAAAMSLGAQPLTDYKEFYRLFRYNALEQLMFCYPTTTAASDPAAVGVRRDSAGRVVQLTRFRFGNVDTRADWATMRVEHHSFDSLKLRTERRTFYDAGGRPVNVDWGFAEELTYRLDGQIVQRKLLDKAGKPVNDSAGVHKAMYQLTSPNNYTVEWRFSNGKLHWGSDGPGRPFAPMTRNAYYRKFVIDDRGDLGREELLNFDKKPTPYPTGEYLHVFAVNDCGQRVKMRFLSPKLEHMTDTNGVAYFTYAYDDAGRMTEWRSFDEDGKPRARPADGVAGMRYTWRAFDGVLLKEEPLGTDGNPLP